MNLFSVFTLAVAAVVVSSTAYVSAASCIICADGVTDSNFAPMASSGDSTTCGELVEQVKVFTEGEIMCDLMKMNEPLCCPQAVIKPCNLCPSGITVGNDFKPNASDGDETTCKEMIDMLSKYESDSTMCLLAASDIEENPCCPGTSWSPPEGSVSDAADELFEDIFGDSDADAGTLDKESSAVLIGGSLVFVSTVSAMSVLFML